MSKCIHANKLHDNLWCSKACMYCTATQEETCWHKKLPGTDFVKTNADHIRSMSDEKLGAYLLCPRDFDPKWWCCDIHCHVCVTDWLKQPYKEDA